jgi:endonuclease/exonuclease/phosphatase family metal-dependent hydrolase
VRILLGDFNATLDHAALRGLIDSGYRDAADASVPGCARLGAGLRPTWPYDEKWFIPGVTLDRVLVDRRVAVRAMSTHRLPGGDHKAVYARLVLPRGAPTT